MTEYSTVNYREISLFKGVTEAQWNDWHWQMRNAITDIGSPR